MRYDTNRDACYKTYYNIKSVDIWSTMAINTVIKTRGEVITIYNQSVRTILYMWDCVLLLRKVSLYRDIQNFVWTGVATFYVFHNARSNGAYIHQNDIRVSASTGRHCSTYIISLFTRHSCQMTIKNELRLSNPSLALSTLCRLLLNRLFRHRSQKTSKLRGIGLCEGSLLVTSEFPKGPVTRKMFSFDDCNVKQKSATKSFQIFQAQKTFSALTNSKVNRK